MTKLIAALWVGLLGLGSSAYAALPAGVATGVTTATTDGVSAVGIAAGLAVAVFVIYKVLKRLGFA